MEANLRLVSSHLDLVSRVSFTLKRIVYPLESGHPSRQIDFVTARQLEHALQPPRPIAAIENAPQLPALPWESESHQKDQRDPEYATVPHLDSLNQNVEPFERRESRSLMLQRLDNVAVRINRWIPSRPYLNPARTQVVTLLFNLFYNNYEICELELPRQLEFPANHPPQNEIDLPIHDLESALRQELLKYTVLEDQIEQKRLHGPRVYPPHSPTSIRTTERTAPMPIPRRRSSGLPSPASLSPDLSNNNNYGQFSTSPDGFRTSLSTSPSHINSRRHSNAPSTSSLSQFQTTTLDQQIPVLM